MKAAGSCTWARISWAGFEPNKDWPEEEGRPDPAQVKVCRVWIRLFGEPMGKIRQDRTSYALKHAVEAWADLEGGPIYIANGAFIAAALAEGYRAERTSEGSPNAYFNMRLKKAHP